MPSAEQEQAKEAGKKRFQQVSGEYDQSRLQAEDPHDISHAGIPRAELGRAPAGLKTDNEFPGQKEAENGTVSVRSRKQVDMGAMSVEDFLTLALKEIAAKQK